MAFKKLKKAASAVYYGSQDYATERQRLSAQAEKNAGYGSGSLNSDVANHAKELDRLMREAHLSWGGSIKKRYKSS